MKITVFSAAAMLLAVLHVTAVAQDDVPVPTAQNDVSMDVGKAFGKGCCDICCCNSGGFIYGAEATFFKYYEAGGVEDSGTQDGEFDYDIGYRLTVGYANCNGGGIRLRYWDHDADTLSTDDDRIAVDTYNIDVEAFQCVDLGCCTTAEFSAGIRYNEFRLFKGGAPEIYRFDGIGGMLALEVHRDHGCGWGSYARLREVVLVNDAIIDDNDEADVVRTVTEIALGVDYQGCNMRLHGGLEWQHWGNYAGDANDPDDPLDAGFFGFVVGAEMAY